MNMVQGMMNGGGINNIMNMVQGMMNGGGGGSAPRKNVNRNPRRR